MAFPPSPILGDRHYTHTQTWEWDGANWVQVFGIDDSAILRVNPDEPTGQFPGVQASVMGGSPITVEDVAEFDLLQYRTGAWRNTPQTNITDGGNF